MELKSVLGFGREAYLLDTNTVIAILKGDPIVKSFLLDKATLGCSFEISVITESEILAGMAQEDETVVYEFLNSKEPKTVDRRLARLTGNIRREKKFEGRVCKTPDALLIATCIIHELILVSGDKKLLKFAEFCGVQVVDMN